MVPKTRSKRRKVFDGLERNLFQDLRLRAISSRLSTNSGSSLLILWCLKSPANKQVCTSSRVCLRYQKLSCTPKRARGMSRKYSLLLGKPYISGSKHAWDRFPDKKNVFSIRKTTNYTSHLWADWYDFKAYPLPLSFKLLIFGVSALATSATMIFSPSPELVVQHWYANKDAFRS